MNHVASGGLQIWRDKARRGGERRVLRHNSTRLATSRDGRLVRRFIKGELVNVQLWAQIDGRETLNRLMGDGD